MKHLYALDTSNIFNYIQNKTSNILKEINDLKIFMVENQDMFGNETNKIAQNEQFLEKAAEIIYSINFNIQNIDLVPEYDEDQLNIIDEPEETENADDMTNTDVNSDSDSFDNEMSDEEADFDLDNKESDLGFDELDEDFDMKENTDDSENQETDNTENDEELEFNFPEE